LVEGDRIEILENYGIREFLLSSSRPEQWALESLAVVRSQVYLLPALGEIKPSYIEKARAVIRTRLAQAGARLALVLNDNLR
jgi:hypothetical protein